LLTDLANKRNIIQQIEYLLAKKEQYNSPGVADDMVGLIEDIDSKSKNLVRSFHCSPQLRKVVLAYVDKLDNKHPTIVKMELLLDIMNAKLRTLPSEQVQREKYLAKVKERQIANQNTVDELEEQLSEANHMKHMELVALNEQLRKIKSDLYQAEQFTEEQIRRTRNEMEKQMRSDLKNSDNRVNKLNLEIQNTKQKHAIAIIEHQELEEKLRRKKTNIEKQIEEWVNKYDKEVGELQSEIDHLTDELEDLRKRRAELFEKFSVLEVDYLRIMNERRIQQEKEEKERQEFEEKTQSAEIIQAFFRSYKVRKAIMYKGKKGKGKKGKKGK